MAYMYAYLIIKGARTYSQVPEQLKDAVKEALVELDCGNLAVE
jgi:hypothetical protein